MLRDLLSDLRFRFRVLFQRAEAERELAEELQSHIDVEADRLVREGMSEHEARRRARLAFGDVENTKEATRDARGLRWLDSTSQDLRYAVRSLRRSAGFTAAVVLTIALGLGANAALFSVIDRLLLRPPAYLRDPARVRRVAVYSLLRGRRDIPELWMSQVRYTNIERTARSFDRIAGFLFETVSVGAGASAQREVIGVVTDSYFDFFDARPVQGRFINSADSVGPADEPVVVLSYGYWRDHLGARADVVGTAIVVGADVRTIIGVAPPEFLSASPTTRHRHSGFQ